MLYTIDKNYLDILLGRFWCFSSRKWMPSVQVNATIGHTSLHNFELPHQMVDTCISPIGVSLVLVINDRTYVHAAYIRVKLLSFKNKKYDYKSPNSVTIPNSDHISTQTSGIIYEAFTSKVIV